MYSTPLVLLFRQQSTSIVNRKELNKVEIQLNKPYKSKHLSIGLTFTPLYVGNKRVFGVTDSGHEQVVDKEFFICNWEKDSEKIPCSSFIVFYRYGGKATPTGAITFNCKEEAEGWISKVLENNSVVGVSEIIEVNSEITLK